MAVLLFFYFVSFVVVFFFIAFFCFDLLLSSLLYRQAAGIGLAAEEAQGWHSSVCTAVE